MKREARAYLHDVRESGELNLAFTRGMTLGEYRQSELTKANVLVHGYDAIDDATVWSAIQDNLPVLLREVRMLAQG